MKMKVKNLDILSNLILPKCFNLPSIGCFLIKDKNHGFCVIFNGVQFIPILSKNLIKSIQSNSNKTIVSLDDRQTIGEVVIVIQQCLKKINSGTTLIIENLQNRELILSILKTILKKEILGLYLKKDIVIVKS